MLVALEAHTPCQECGYEIRVVMCGTARINKRSIRVAGPLIGALEHHACPQCGTEVAGDAPRTPYRLLADDAVRVAAYREEKWGVAASEAAERGAG